MAQIILVHGMAATKHSWFEIPSALEEQGHSVINRTMPGHLNSMQTLDTTLDDYVSAVADQFHTAEKAILVGHSMGGFIISEVAARFPDRVENLIYVSAMLPKTADTISKLMLQSGTSIIEVVTAFEKVGIGADHRAIGSQPRGPLNDRFTETPGFSAIQRHYIRSMDDLVLKPPFQEEMLANWPGTTISEIPTGHIPQLSEHTELVRQILEAIG